MIGIHGYVADGAAVQRSVLLDNVTIGRGAVVRNAIIDKNVVVPDDALIGVDHEEDRRRGLVAVIAPGPLGTTDAAVGEALGAFVVPWRWQEQAEAEAENRA